MTINSGKVQRVERLICGALVEASFTSNADLKDWCAWTQDAGIVIDIEPLQGVRMNGVSEMYPEVLRFSSIVSRRFSVTDVVLLCDVRIASSATNLMDEWTHIHLCNTLPDFFGEVVFGRQRGGKPRWGASYANESGFHNTKRSLPAFGDEERSFHTVRIDHDGQSGLTRTYVYSSNEVHSLGVMRVPMSCCKVELKISTSSNGTNHDSCFRNCRLYQHPHRAPLRVAVSFSHPWPGSPIPGVQVRVSRLDGSTIASSTTDSDGYALLHLDASTLYPTPVIFNLSLGHDEIGIVKVGRTGEGGVYPGDVWSFGIANPGLLAEPLYIREALVYGKEHGFISDTSTTMDSCPDQPERSHT